MNIFSSPDRKSFLLYIRISINTFGFNELLGVIEQTCNDSWDLFKDLQRFNPYTNTMIDNLVDKIEKIHKQIKDDAY